MPGFEPSFRTDKHRRRPEAESRTDQIFALEFLCKSLEINALWHFYNPTRWKWRRRCNHQNKHNKKSGKNFLHQTGRLAGASAFLDGRRASVGVAATSALGKW